MIFHRANSNFNSEFHLWGKKKKREAPNHTNLSRTVKIVFAGTNVCLSRSYSARGLAQSRKSLAEFFGWYLTILQNVSLINT